MRRISEMYERSGGCDYKHTCEECGHIYIETGKTRWGHRQQEASCRLYTRLYGSAVWDQKWGACKFFQEQQEPKQMSLWDFMGGNGESNNKIPWK